MIAIGTASRIERGPLRVNGEIATNAGVFHMREPYEGFTSFDTMVRSQKN